MLFFCKISWAGHLSCCLFWLPVPLHFFASLAWILCTSWFACLGCTLLCGLPLWSLLFLLTAVNSPNYK